MAVKVFRLDVVPEVSARLADELNHLAATPVDHPAVVAAIEAGLEGTTAYLAMEYVAAETLDVNLRRLAPAPVETVVPLLREVAAGLDAAWAAGLGHGSLHPRDIFVPAGSSDSAQPGGGVRVAGFGVTAALESLNIPAPVRRPYAAPEREHGGPWDIRADVYSLGVIAYELLTGERPVGSLEEDGDGSQSGLEPDIRRALAGALAVDATYRFQTPTAFIDALGMGEVPHSFDRAATAHATGVAHEPPILASTEEPDREDRPDLEFGVDPEPEAESEPEPDLQAEPEPERVVAQARVDHVRMWPPETAREPAPVEPQGEWRVAPQPEEDAMPRFLGFAAMLVAGLVAGTAFGYWLRGPANPPAADVSPAAPAATKAPDEEPIGTDVTVSQPATPAPTPTQAPAAAAATPAPEPSPESGRLLVRSVPSGATVMLNGRERGTTPATIRDLPFGSYTIAVSRSGYQSREQKVAVSTSVPAREVTIELTPVRAAAPAASAAATGSVYVETRPTGATVSIDGRVVGQAPMRVPELSPGSHSVRVELAGHKTVTTTVVVRAGQQTPLRVSLEIQ